MPRLPRRARARSAAPALLLSFALAALLALPSTADAHARLERSEPGNGATLVTLPRTVRLWFSETPQLPFTHVRLVGPSGKEVALGPAQAIAEHGVSLPIMGELPVGAYTIRWQTGGADGHPTRGEIAFTIVTPRHDAAEPTPPASSPRSVGSAPPAEPAPTATTQPRANEIVAGPTVAGPVAAKKWIAMRWVELVSMLMVLGAVGFRLAVVPRWAGNAPEDAGDAARRYAQPALVLLVVAALARLAAESVAMHGASAYRPGTLAATLLATSWGRGWLTGLVGALVAALGLALAGRRMAGAWSIAAAGSVLLACGASLSGHAMASDRWWAAVPIDAVHVLAAGTWVGGVLMLALVGVPCARREPNGNEAVRRLVLAFNPLAIAMATAVVLTGAASAWMRLGALDALWGSAYGRVLLLKLAVVAAVAALGLYNWRRVTPRLSDEGGSARLRRSAALEALCGVFVLAITAILIVTPTPEPNAAPVAAPTAIAP